MKAVRVKYELDGFKVKRDIKVIDAPTDGNIQFYYDNIECTHFDVARFDGFDVYVDDNGLITSGNVVCEYTQGEFKVPLAGNLVFTKGVDAEGETTFFDNEDIADVDMIIEIIDMVESAELMGVTR